MQKGNHPFGALLVKDGKVLLMAENTVNSENDCTRHAELNLVSRASQELEPAILSRSILYTSTEPCAMCAGAIYWAGIRTVVYSCSAESIGNIAGGQFVIPCRDIFARAEDQVEVIGPILAEEGAEVHEGFW
jgi:tRNA(Arg) A34 adenosine deaminase TadA